MAIAGKWTTHDAKIKNGIVVHGIGRGKSYLETVGLEKPGIDRPSDKLLRERDERLAADTRTPQEIMLGNPPPGRSALDRRRKSKSPTISAVTEPTEKTGICPISVARYG